MYIKNIPTSDYYLDLLVEVTPFGIQYDNFNYAYPESYKELPLYKYNKDGWIAKYIRLGSGYNIENKDYSGLEYRHVFRDNGLPSNFKVIIQHKSGELFVSKNTYTFNRSYQRTYIDFESDMITADYIYGDLNGDSIVNSLDYAILKRYVLKIIQELPSPDAINAADVNGDGNIDSIDCTLIKRYILNIITKFPVEDLG